MEAAKILDKEEKSYPPQEVEFLQRLLDRYSENGGIIDLLNDHQAFMRIVRRCFRSKIAPTAENEREDLQLWQQDQREFFDATVLEIVSEYAAWRDNQEAAKQTDVSLHCFACGEAFPQSCNCSKPSVSWKEIRAALSKA